MVKMSTYNREQQNIRWFPLLSPIVTNYLHNILQKSGNNAHLFCKVRDFGIYSRIYPLCSQRCLYPILYFKCEFAVVSSQRSRLSAVVCYAQQLSRVDERQINIPRPSGITSLPQPWEEEQTPRWRHRVVWNLPNCDTTKRLFFVLN